MAKKTMADVDVAGKTVVMRVDFNVPLLDGRIESDRRIVQALPTIEEALRRGGRLVLMSHLGQPEDGFEEELSLKIVAERLGKHRKKPVPLGPPSVVGPELDRMVAAMKPGDALLLENLRFHSGETIPDQAKTNPDKNLTPQQQAIHDELVSGIAKHGDLYVNDAFGTCHRDHASMLGVPMAMQARGCPAVAGYLVEKELRHLSPLLGAPDKPYVAVLGGGKVADKLKLLSALAEKVDRLLIGGGMAYTLLHAQGVSVGKSKTDAGQVDAMKKLLGAAGDKIVLPLDHVAAAWYDPDKKKAGPPIAVAGSDIPADLVGLDIGPKTINAFAQVLSGARTILWNGPMGVSEIPDFARGTEAIAWEMARATARGAVTVVGGGDSAAVVEKLGLEAAMTHVSTGGGASLNYLEGKTMRPIKVLDEK